MNPTETPPSRQGEQAPRSVNDLELEFENETEHLIL
jgi:hypothetical protein